jgi:hypothetical protein
MKLSEYKKPPGQDWSEYIAMNGCAVFIFVILILAAIGFAIGIITWLLGVFGYTIIHTPST